MDDSQQQEQPETQPSAAAAAPTWEEPSLGDRVREVREHLERASAALATLDQLLPASTQPRSEADDRGQQ